MTPRRRRDDPFWAALQLWSVTIEAWTGFWLSLLEPNVNEPPDDLPRSADVAGDQSSAHLSDEPEVGMLVPVMYRRDVDVDVETVMNDSSFLNQLEQRTQQVKITLANLEAEKTRIEGLITRLQPLVPHYDALLDAERSINDANIELERAGDAPDEQPQSWEQEHQAPPDQGWSGSP